MDTLEVTTNNIEELTVERNNCIPSIISSLDDADSLKLLENLKLCIKYLPTYSVSHVCDELLQYITPAIKRNLHKVYEDNFLLSDTVDDDLILNILKENLEVALSFIHVVKDILEFLSENSEISLNSLNNVPVNVVEMILFTFEHCKNSPDEYKTKFNIELLEIFRITQDVHLLFLRLFESSVIIMSDCDTDNSKEVKEFSQVLDIICNMSEILSEISIKSMSDNWKGYIAIVQKFSSILSDVIDLRLPVQHLTSVINRNLSSLENLDDIDVKLITQVVKISGFLIKVALKFFDIFWNNLEAISQELLKLCCTIYRYPSDIYHSKGCPSNILDLIENSLCKPLEPFLLRLVNDSAFEKVFSSDISSYGHHFGRIIFLSNTLKLLSLCEERPEKFGIGSVIRAIFENVKLCFSEFFFDSHSERSVFENLILNITASVFIYAESYAEIERILFENVLQEHIWAALLAIEVWTLVLHNSTSQVCLDTLLNLIKKHQEIDFGTYTQRPEQIYMKCLMQRLFSILPVDKKNELIFKFCPIRNIHVWKMIEFHQFPVQQRSAIEDIYTATVDTIEKIGRDNLSSKNICILAENLGVLSTVKFNEMGLNTTKLISAVCSLWEFDVNNGLLNNNAFKYFMGKLCKITGSFMMEIGGNQLINILAQLKFLSTDDFYKLMVCETLSSFSKKPAEYNQDEHKINALVTDILYPNLLLTNKPIIKQNTLELVHSFGINGKQDIIRSIMGSAREMQGEISDYLQMKVAPNDFDKEYFASLGRFRFQHECIAWRRDTVQPQTKRPKTNEFTFAEDPRGIKEKTGCERMGVLKPSVAKMEVEFCQFTDYDEDRVSEVIDNIKGDVKCLLKVLKTEKLSRKNASDIKLISSQLLSLL